MSDRTSGDPPAGPTYPAWPRWKPAAAALIRRVSADLATAEALRVSADPQDVQCYARVEESCTAAQRYIDSASWWLPTWHSGVPDATFRAGHAADVELVEVLTDEQFRRKVPEVLALAAAYLPADDWRRITLEKRWAPAVASGGSPTAPPADASGPDPADREQLATTLKAAYDLLDLAQLKVRQFRNVLVGIVMVLVVLLGGLTLIGSISPSSVPMCGLASAATRQTCATGGEAPSGGDVALVALLGVIGGTLASALSLSGLGDATSTRYSLAVWQAAVKVMFGGAAAVLGILLVRAGFSSIVRLDGQFQILALAVIFGYSQQLLTRLIDREASALTSDASPTTPAPAKGGVTQQA